MLSKQSCIYRGCDDKHLELTHGVNPGRSKAEEAAKATGGKVLLPIFSPGEQSYPASLEPITPTKFRNGDLSQEQLAALSRIKQYTEFNDLVAKSVFGEEGIERQVRAIVNNAIDARSADERQTVRAHRQEQQPSRGVKIG